MKRKELLAMYKEAVERTGFKENKKEGEWMPKLGPDDYRSLTRYGMYHSVPATISVSSPGTFWSLVVEAQRYQREQELFPLIVKIPEILTDGGGGWSEYVVQKKEIGQRVHAQYPFSTQTEKKEIARLYYNTEHYFTMHPVLFEPPKISAPQFFKERMERYADSDGFLSQSDVATICFRLGAGSCAMKMRPFFAHFTNTDIIKNGDQYFTCDATMALRPEMYGAAFWIWGATMYAKNIHYRGWVKEVREWLECFNEHREKGDMAIETNLVERMAGMLMVDLPLRRAPFEQFSFGEIEKMADVARAVLEEVM